MDNYMETDFEKNWFEPDAVKTNEVYTNGVFQLNQKICSVESSMSVFALPSHMQLIMWHLAQGGKGGTALSFVQCSFLSLPFHPDSKLESGA